MNISTLNDPYLGSSKNSRPIPDAEIIEFINKQIDPKYLYDGGSIQSDFINKYFNWIQASKLNSLPGLEKFNALDFVHGTSQAFDFFYLNHHGRRFRCFKSDFAYHKVSWKLNMNWKFLEEDDLREGDALVLSIPFSDYGGLHPMTDSLIQRCNELNIPVLIDAAYYGMARDINFNVDQPCIDTITFSLSKVFYGADKLRIGIRCRKVHADDGCLLFNQYQQVSKLAVAVGLKLIENFETDHTQNKFREKQLEVCKELNIEPSNCITFGLATKDHPEFGGNDRGSEWRRVCISKQLSNCYNDEN